MKKASKEDTINKNIKKSWKVIINCQNIFM